MPEGFKIADGYVDVEIDQGTLDASIAAVEAKLAAIKNRAIEVGLNQNTVDRGIAVIQAKLKALQARIGVEINSVELAQAVAEINAYIEKLQNRLNVHIEFNPAAIAGLAALDKQASSLDDHINAAKDAMAALAAISFTGVGAGVGGGVVGTWTAWAHWIIAGGAELAAVVIPATVALGAATAVVAQGAQQVSQHFTAMWTAAEATSNIFHQTLGTMLGFTAALQKAQNAAGPMVFQALAGALKLAHDQFASLSQTGLEVTRVFDTFIAHIQLDFQQGFGGTVHTLLSKMVVDLVTLGQIFGNVGHAILNFGAAMPGLANVLLNFLNVLSRILLTLSELPTWLITTVFALEELYRWGGLAVTIFARLGAAVASLGTLGLPLIASFGERFAAVFTVIGETVGGFLLNMGLTIEKMGSAEAEAGKLAKGVAGVGSSVANAGLNIGSMMEGIGGWQAALIGLGILGFGALVIWAARSKTAIQEWADSMNTSLAKTSDLLVVNKLAADLTQTTVKLSSAQADLNKTMKDTYTVAQSEMNRYSILNPVIQQQQVAVSQLTQEHKYLNQQLVNVYGSLGFLESRYGTTYVGALALAQQAGVNLTVGLTRTSQAADIARLKVADLVAGYQMMGQSAGVVGIDMTALAMQAALQTTKVQQLNQAWDQYISMVTGGMGALAAFTTSMQGLYQLTAQTVDATTGFTTTGTVTATLKEFQAALAAGPTGQTGASAWTNFTQIVNQSQTGLLDWLRTAGAVGAISGPQFVQAVKDMVAQLLPFAGTSQQAVGILSDLAHEAGGPTTTNLQTLKNWLGNTSNATTDLGNIIDTTTNKMVNMSQIAQNLGNVLNQQIVQTMDAAQVKTSGLSLATEKYTQDLQNASTPTKQLTTDHNNLVGILTKLTGSQTTANQIVDTYTKQVVGPSGGSGAQGTTEAFNTKLTRLQQAMDNNVTPATTNLKNATHNLSGEYSGLAKVGNVNLNIHIAASGSWTSIGAGFTIVPHAAQGMKIPGFGGGDVVPIMAEPGEAVISKETTRMMAPLFKAFKVPGFASGGIVPGFSGTESGLGSWLATDFNSQETSLESQWAAAIAQAMKMSVASAGFAGGPAGGGSATNQAIGKGLAAAFGWSTGTPWLDLVSLWNRESGWNNFAMNPSSHAYGIPQSLPFTKMPQAAWPASAGGQSNASAQIGWGLNYIKGRYVNPSTAWAHEIAFGWYDHGGYLPPGMSLALNTTGAPEKVGGSTVINMNWYGPQMPSPEQRQMIAREMALKLVSPA